MYFESSVALTSPKGGGRVVAPLQGNSRRVTNIKATYSVLDFPQYGIECSVNRPATRDLFLRYDVPYRSIIYLLYPCVNIIYVHSHNILASQDTWIHSAANVLIKEELGFCIPQCIQDSLETSLFCPVIFFLYIIVVRVKENVQILNRTVNK
jgi:hypothetical protein